MPVSVRWYEPRQAWQLQWRASGKRTVYVRVSAVGGNKDAAKRVANCVKAHIDKSVVRDDVSLFGSVIASFIARELNSLAEGGGVAAAPVAEGSNAPSGAPAMASPSARAERSSPASLKPKKMSNSDAHPAAKRRHVRTNIRKKPAVHPDSLVCGLCDGKASALAAALIQELLHNVGLPRRA